MKERLVAVVWDDAHVDQGETFSDKDIIERTPYQFTTFGLLVRNDDRLVGVASELCVDGNFRGVTFVPKSLVSSIVPLGPWPRRQRKPVTSDQ